MAGISAVVAVVAVAASVAGTIVSAVTQDQAAKRQAEAMREQARRMREAAAQQNLIADQQEQAAYETQLIAYDNAARIEAETLEAARREKLAQDKILAEQRTRAAASGSTGAGSVGLFLDEQEDESTRQIEWLTSAGFSRANIERWEGRLAQTLGRIQAAGTRLAATNTAASAAYQTRVAGITQSQGRAGLIAGGVSAAGSALSLGSSAYDKYFSSPPPTHGGGFALGR